MAVRTPVRAKTKKRTKAKAQTATRSRRRTSRKLSADVAKLRDWLLQERERLGVELQEIERRSARLDESDRATELSAYEDHPADLASETFEREKDLAIGESVQGMLNKVNTALEKTELGTYGTCDACGRPIKKARLKALPFATLCLNCQDRLER